MRLLAVLVGSLTAAARLAAAVATRLECRAEREVICARRDRAAGRTPRPQQGVSDGHAAENVIGAAGDEPWDGSGADQSGACRSPTGWQPVMGFVGASKTEDAAASLAG